VARRRLRLTLRASIEFLPTPSLATTVTARYVPVFTLLSDLVNDFISTVNGWHKLIALKVAIEMRVISKLDSSDLAALYTVEHDRIQALADQRAAGRNPANRRRGGIPAVPGVGS
jgi:hypothetical protein